MLLSSSYRHRRHLRGKHKLLVDRDFSRLDRGLSAESLSPPSLSSCPRLTSGEPGFWLLFALPSSRLMLASGAHNTASAMAMELRSGRGVSRSDRISEEEAQRGGRWTRKGPSLPISFFAAWYDRKFIHPCGENLQKIRIQLHPVSTCGFHLLKILFLILIWRVERCGLHHQRVFLRSTHVLRNQRKKAKKVLHEMEQGHILEGLPSGDNLKRLHLMNKDFQLFKHAMHSVSKQVDSISKNVLANPLHREKSHEPFREREECLY